MIDFHTHILPGMDDGSKNVHESLQMLRMERQQGIKLAMLTPHYYSNQNSPEQFLRRRQRSWEALHASLEEGLPQLLLGAEVYYFEGITNLESISRLCIQGTRLLLLEMPFCSWEERVVQTVLALNGTDGIQIVLAHIERYLSFLGNSRALDLLRRGGILMQMNTSAFDGWFSARRASSMVQKEKVHFLGSDCHNTTLRKPDWERLPQPLRRPMDQRSKALLQRFIIR